MTLTKLSARTLIAIGLLFFHGCASQKSVVTTPIPPAPQK